MQPPKFHLQNRGTKRRPNYCVRYSVGGTEYREPTGARTRLEYDAYVQHLARRFLLGTWTPPERDARHGLTFELWAPQAIAKRVARGIKTAATDEAAIVRNHLIPEFGASLLHELTSLQRVVEGFDRIREKVRAGSTVRNIHVVFAAVMRLAAKDGKISAPPPLLTVKDGELPPVVCMKPEGWRADAKFTREEIASLIGCDEVELQYRVMYVVYFLTGSRFAEVITAKWRAWDRDRSPLGSLMLRAVKTPRDKGQMYRLVPVHPTLRAWLTWWHREGFELVHGRAPMPDDLMFPTCSRARQKRADADGVSRIEILCAYNEVYGAWTRRHLPAAKLRHRRLHDARGTFISIIRSAGGSGDIVRLITHRAVTDKVLDEGYTVFDWEVVCGAVSAVDWRLPGPPSSSAVVVDISRSRRRLVTEQSGPTRP
jgi:integrase